MGAGLAMRVGFYGDPVHLMMILRAIDRRHPGGNHSFEEHMVLCAAVLVF